MEPGSGVILYVSSSPDSSSSGYQTLSPSSHSRSSSPEEVSSSESSSLHPRNTGADLKTTSSSPKLVFHRSEDSSAPVSSTVQRTYSPSLTSKKPCPPNTSGMVLLCKVCGDVASGFHYGVHACEGCKGFFRRSIQQNISYKMCVKNQSCLIVRMNRNRCQHCRFKKCLSVGMSRDAVRFGRIPKREKQRLLEEIRSYMNSQTDSNTPTPEAPPTGAPPSSQEHQSTPETVNRVPVLSSTNVSVKEEPELEEDKHDDRHLVYHIHPTSTPICPNEGDMSFTTAGQISNAPEVDVKKETLESSCPWRAVGAAKVLACPLNSCPVSPADRTSQQIWDDFSQSFSPAVKDVVEFSRTIPGFHSLNQNDQITLLKSGTFQVLMVRFCSLFNARKRTVTFLDGQTYPLPALRAFGMGTLLDAMFEFSEKMGMLGLEPDEMALFMAVVLLSADRTGISNMAAVETLQEDLIGALRSLLTQRRPNDMEIFPKLLLRLPDLRTLNSLHSEKLLAFRIDS